MANSLRNTEDKMELENKKPNVIAENYIGGDNYENISAKNLNINSNNPTTNNEIPNKNPDATKNSINVQFWKLISENKLISSILVVVIFCIINKVFGINFKIS